MVYNGHVLLFFGTDRPFQFVGRINEDVNAYCSFGFRGHLFMTVAQLRLEQKQTQSNADICLPGFT